MGASGNEVASLDGHNGAVNSASLRPDGMQIVTASNDGSAKVWDLAGNEVASLKGHMAWVMPPSFSPNSTQIVTAGCDVYYGSSIICEAGSAKVWDLAGNEMASLEGIEGVINTASFSPEGRHIVTAGTDGSVKVWAAYPAMAENIARQRLGDKDVAFTEEQCKRFFPHDDQDSCPRTLDELFSMFEDDLERP